MCSEERENHDSTTVTDGSIAKKLKIVLHVNVCVAHFLTFLVVNPRLTCCWCWWMHVCGFLLSAVESGGGQPHSSCLLRAAARAARCFSISWVTIVSTVSAVWGEGEKVSVRAREYLKE